MNHEKSWTVETLRELLEEKTSALEKAIAVQKIHADQLISAQKEAIAAAMAAADRAVTKAETAAEKRFESVNEFRAAMGDRERAFMPRSELEVLIGGLHNRVNELTARIDRSDGRKTGFGDGWGWAVGAVGLVVGLVMALMKMMGK